MSGGQYMVVDSNLGILSAAIMDKTLGNCSIVKVFTENCLIESHLQAVCALNFSDSTVGESISSIHMDKVAQLLDADDGDDESQLPVAAKNKRQERRMQEEMKARSILRNKNLDGLLILTKNYDPRSIVEILLEFLSISRPFVIFSSTMEPLKECYIHLKSKCVYLRISETWLRKYQVLNDRTRPDMVMSPCSGFLLSGIKVQM